MLPKLPLLIDGVPAHLIVARMLKTGVISKPITPAQVAPKPAPKQVPKSTPAPNPVEPPVPVKKGSLIKPAPRPAGQLSDHPKSVYGREYRHRKKQGLVRPHGRKMRRIADEESV